MKSASSFSSELPLELSVIEMAEEGQVPSSAGCRVAFGISQGCPTGSATWLEQLISEGAWIIES